MNPQRYRYSTEAAETRADMTNWIFSGIDRNGSNRTGVISGDQSPAEIARKRWESGWRSLDVRSDDEQRRQVARIEPSGGIVGCYGWWAEDGHAGSE
jgi:hypothetical protein